MKNYQLSTTFLTRTPLLSLNHHVAKVWKSEGLAALKAAYSEATLQQALFLASPVLYTENQKWQAGEIKGSEEMHLAQGLWRYLLRMSSRCTPFGMFAGVSVGEWASERNLLLQSSEHQAHTRLDMEYLGALAQHLAQQPALRAAMRFYPNNSLYESGEKLRYVDYRYDKKRRIHQIVSIDNSDYVQAVLARAAKGALPSDLAQVLVSEDITLEEATDFIEEMITAQVLISELDGRTTAPTRPSPEGKECHQYSQLSSKLDGVLRTNIDYLLNPIHYQIPPSDIFKEKLVEIGVPYDLSKLFQTDLAKNTTHCQLDKRIAGSLRKGLSICNRLSSRPKETTLSKFAQAFSERYEEKELPLLEVLDVETGIGYLQRGDTQGDINLLVDDLLIGGTAGEEQITWNTRQSFLLKKLLTAQQENAYEVSLDFKEIEKFEEKWDDVAPSISVMFSVLEHKEGEKLPKVIFENAGGLATRLLGRFTTMDDRIHQWCSDIATAEQQHHSDAIIAEIVYLPENRVGNILMRSTFRAYEIPYLAQSSVAEDFQIPLQDLMVSVRGGSVILRSKRLQKRIIPSLGNAHNYSHNALPVYHFLCDLQNQNQRSGFGFHWGSLASQFSFLPRVCHENLILHRATWQLNKADFEILTKSKPNELMQNVADWQTKWKMPNRVLIVQGDNELLIDLRHELSVQTFISEIKNSSQVILAEFLFPDENSMVKDEKGENYTNECVAVFLKESKIESEKSKVENVESKIESEESKVENVESKIESEEVEIESKESKIKSEESKVESKRVERRTTESEIRRSFPIGSEWLYFKIYCGAATTDELLCHSIYPLVQQFLENDWINDWFFIRYTDPKNHIRIRFHLKNQENTGNVSNALYNALENAIEQKQIWKLQTDTYEREMERYGTATMELSEQLFCLDSRMTLDFLSQIDSFQSNYRWLFGIAAIDALLVAFEYDLAQKTKLLEGMKTSFGKEFGMNKHLRKQMNEKYDTFEIQINTLFQKEIEDENLAFVRASALQHQEELKTIALKIKGLLSENQLQDVLGSYIHMTMNRLFKSKQRMYEMVVYDFLYKNYKTMAYK